MSIDKLPNSYTDGREDIEQMYGRPNPRSDYGPSRPLTPEIDSVPHPVDYYAGEVDGTSAATESPLSAEPDPAVSTPKHISDLLEQQRQRREGR